MQCCPGAGFLVLEGPLPFSEASCVCRILVSGRWRDLERGEGWSSQDLIVSLGEICPCATYLSFLDFTFHVFKVRVQWRYPLAALWGFGSANEWSTGEACLCTCSLPPCCAPPPQEPCVLTAEQECPGCGMKHEERREHTGFRLHDTWAGIQAFSAVWPQASDWNLSISLFPVM
jgi:hypothetical protein